MVASPLLLTPAAAAAAAIESRTCGGAVQWGEVGFGWIEVRSQKGIPNVVGKFRCHGKLPVPSLLEGVRGETMVGSIPRTHVTVPALLLAGMEGARVRPKQKGTGVWPVGRCVGTVGTILYRHLAY